MLLVRRNAPEGSYFKDGDRASGVFGVLAGGFAISAGFIIFLTFPWSVALFRSLKLAEPKTVSEQAAYGKWLDQTSDREEARRDRLHGAGAASRHARAASRSPPASNLRAQRTS